MLLELQNFYVINNFNSYLICVRLIIGNVPFSCRKSRARYYFLMFHCLNYSVTFNESKEKFKIVFLDISKIRFLFVFHGLIKKWFIVT